MHLLSKVLVVIRKKKVFWLHLPFKGEYTVQIKIKFPFRIRRTLVVLSVG